MSAMRPRGWILAGAAATVGAFTLGVLALLDGGDVAARDSGRRTTGDELAEVAIVLPDAVEVREISDLRPAESDLALTEAEDAPLAAPEAPPPPGERIVFSGRVLGLDGAPLAGARVLLVPDGRTLRALGRRAWRGSRVNAVQPTDLAETTSGADGRFELAAHVVLKKPGEPNDAGNPTVPVLVVRAEHAADFGHACLDLPGGSYEAGDLPLMEGAAVAGRVVDERGWALRDVRVVANVSDGPPGGRPPGDVEGWLHTVTTGEDGRFEIDRLPGTAVELYLSAADRAPLDVEARPVQAGEVTQHGDLVLPAGEDVAGTVVAPDGRPVAGARVAAVFIQLGARGTPHELEQALQQLRDREERAASLTDAQGRFALGGLQGGNLSLVAAFEGHEAALVHEVAPGRRDVVLALRPPAELVVRAIDRSTRQPVAGTLVARRTLFGWWSGAGELPTLPVEPLPERPGEWRVLGVGPMGTQLVLEAPGYAAGTLNAPGVAPGAHDTHVLELEKGLDLQGVVRDGTGTAVPDAGLTLLKAGRRGPQGSEPRTRSDSEGRFRFANLGPGSYTVRGEAKGHVTGESAETLLDPQRPAIEVEVELERAGSLEGRLLASDGKPAAGRLARARRASGVPGPTRSARTDTSGRFVLRDLAPGLYDVTSVPLARAQALVEPGGTAQVELQLARPGELHGTVYAATGPVAGAEVSADGETRWLETTTDERGRYAFVLDPGEWTVNVASPDGGTQQVTLSLAAGEQRTLDILLPGGRLDVLALQPDGAPAVDAWLELVPYVEGEESNVYDSWRHQGARAGADETGHALFQHVEPGRYQVVAIDDDWLCDEPVEVEVGEQPASATIQLRPAARITGRLVTPAGLPAPDGTPVQLFSVEGERESRGGTAVRNGDGRFTLTGLDAGSYLLTARKGWESSHDTAGALAERLVTLEQGQTLDLVLAIR